MNNVVILMDIGGTNTRVRITSAASATSPDQEELAFTQVKLSDKQSLFDFIAELIARYNLKNRIKAAVLCFAGPVIRHNKVAMTNWTGERCISYSELRECGLPTNTMLFNDVEAACYYFVSPKQNERQTKITGLYPGQNGNTQTSGSIVLMIPGTGIGTAGIIFPKDPDAQVQPMIIGSEIQHACVATLDAGDAGMLEKIAGQLGKDRLSWEDIISGQGLMNIFSWLTNEAADNYGNINPAPLLWAEEIAERAVRQTDADCISALNIYYRYAGALAQLLALCYQPLGGIYLAGETTIRNASFIQQSHFLAELHHSTTQRELLQSYPVYLIEDEINLQGAAYLARLHINGNGQVSLFA